MLLTRHTAKKAEEWDVIERQPCVSLLLPIPPPSAPFHDLEEFARLVEAARKRGAEAHLVVLLGGEAGLRRDEIAALEWGDVNLKAAVVRATVRVTGPDGRAEGRSVALRAVDAATGGRTPGGAAPRGPRVFRDADGQAVSENVIGHHVEHAARAAQLAHRGVHVLRHTFCSHLAIRGAPARAMQELAGHADLRTTQRYMHLSPAALDAAIRLLDPGTDRASFGDSLETAPRPSASLVF